MRVLCLELPVRTGRLAVPLFSSMKSATKTFSPPLSQRMRSGSRCAVTAALNSGSTVSDLLLSLTARYTMVRVAPSMQPCTTSPYLMSLWFPSICHRAYGAVIVYSRRGIRFRFRAATPAGSTRWSEARTRSRETAMPSPSRNPAVMTAPRPLLQSLCCFTKASSSSSETVRFGSSKPEVFRQVYKVLSETSTCKAIFFHDSPTSRH
mmetsp:Transcript_22103/g.49148  ORF Transcript_22103/g.49148 Transcript_22103/m.49148 type:complete len:207 (+) Transcript_22103:625-1245(+)